MRSFIICTLHQLLVIKLRKSLAGYVARMWRLETSKKFWVGKPEEKIAV
jgi:hypothetical protein